MSSFLNVSVLVLATMVLVLAGMVGYVYWQQSKIVQVVGSLSNFVATQFVPPVVDEEESDDEEEEETTKDVEVVEVVLPTTDDVDDLQTKSSGELRDLLSAKGIPYGKRDSKTLLLQLLKASA